VPRAIWNDTVLAESDETIILEGNHYFPPDSINHTYFRRSDKLGTCPWKGVASYYDIVVDGDVNPGAAWTYPKPKDAAGCIANYVAFWKGVVIEQSTRRQ
jgi:uncharacterized protein (DUF427 family)